MKKAYETERLILKVLDETYVNLVLDYYLRNESFLEEWKAEKDKDFYTKEFQEEQRFNKY